MVISRIAVCLLASSLLATVAFANHEHNVAPVFPSGAIVAVHRVPEDFDTIQEAVDASAVSGDVVLVGPGSYAEAVLVSGKTIDIVSSSGSSSTTVDAVTFERPPTGGVGGGSLDGFTVSDSLRTWRLNRDFLVVRCTLLGNSIVATLPQGDTDDGRVEFDDCQIEAILDIRQENFFNGVEVHDCEVTGAGMSISSEGAAGVTNCVFSDAPLTLFGEIVGVTGNVFEGSGAVIVIDSQFGTVADNEVTLATIGLDVCASSSANAAVRGNVITGCGTGLVIDSLFDGDFSVEDNTILDCVTGIDGPGLSLVSLSGNVVAGGTTGVTLDGLFVVLTANTIAGTSGAGLTVTSAMFSLSVSRNIVAMCATGVTVPPGNVDPSELTCNDVWNNAGGNWFGVANPTGSNGNISVDPLFCDVARDDYSLEDLSPCRPGQHPDGAACGFIGAVEVECVTVGVPETTANLTPLTVFPNPSRDAVHFTVAGAEFTVARIIDVAGRVVRELSVSASRSELTWDGMTDGGLSAPPGVYFLDAETSSSRVRARFVRSR